MTYRKEMRERKELQEAYKSTMEEVKEIWYLAGRSETDEKYQIYGKNEKLYSNSHIQIQRGKS